MNGKQRALLALALLLATLALGLAVYQALAPAPLGPTLGAESAGDTNFTNVVASGDLTAGDDLTVGDDVTITDDVAISGALTVSGSGSVAGNLSITGIVHGGINYTAVTTDTTVTAAQQGMLFANQGASGAVVMDLPAAAEGLNYCFFVAAAQNFDINAATGDQIHTLTNAAGDAVRNATPGGYLCLAAIDATYWVNVGSGGTWSDVN